MNELYMPISTFKNIGIKRREKYNKLGINTLYDLLYHIPRDYTDYGKSVLISQAVIGENTVLKLKIKSKLSSTQGRNCTIYKLLATDGVDDITIVIFNNVYLFNSIIVNSTYYFYGKVKFNSFGYELSFSKLIQENQSLIQPVYHLTEGLTANMVIANVKQAIQIMKSQPFEILPEYIIKENNLCSIVYALENIHFPENSDAITKARKRLAFDEILMLQLGMAFMKSINKKHTANIMNRNTDISEFYANLPFEMTDGQKNAVNEILDDLCSDVPMNRLLQGDVGSGKTAVATAVCYFAAKNGFQSALMAPTEILAHQHYDTLSNFLNPLGINVCLLTGSVSESRKTEMKEKIKNGFFNVIVGTHALIQKNTEFKSLALVITDEQHRFGVSQRSALAEKGDFPHKLVMSATPIPRTLALMVYGELDVSVINQLPKGRKPISTYAVTDKMRERAFGFVKKELDEGRQAYIVCPAIKQSESNLNSVNEYFTMASTSLLKGYSIGLLHGQMSSDEKENVMNDFKQGKIQVLICTTVVEVGVDVPNASIIVVENAERFGLSQLHQLRGRVGRGEYESSCILIADSESVNDDIRSRMKIMCSTTNGFEISEQDLKLRGPGDFFGNRQHGLPPLKFVDMECDMDMMNNALNTVKNIIQKDPNLDLLENNCLKVEMLKMFDKELVG